MWVFAWITFTNRLLHSIAVQNLDLRFVGDYWLIFPMENPLESLGLGNQLKRFASINSIYCSSDNLLVIVIAGYFYGIIHSINGVISVLILGTTWAITVVLPDQPIHTRSLGEGIHRAAFLSRGSKSV